jgi:hypothetical protein
MKIWSLSREPWLSVWGVYKLNGYENDNISPYGEASKVLVIQKTQKETDSDPRVLPQIFPKQEGTSTKPYIFRL